MAAHPLPAVIAFARVAHLGSFTRAAAELEVSTSALSQTVRGLEERLGVRLLNRTTRRVGLTEHGARFLAQVGPGLAQIDAAFDDLDAVRERPTGRLRINAGRIAIRSLIEPRLPEFLARYPDVQVELFADDTLADLVAGGFDAGIRLGECLARDMVARPIGGPQRTIVVGSPDYYARRGTPRVPEDLIHHDCIRQRLPGSGRMQPWEFTRDGRDFEVDVGGRLIFNDSSLARAPLLAGLGLGQLFPVLVADHLAAGRLVQVLDRYTPPFPGFHIYYTARRQLAPKLRAFVDFMCQDE
ncbi:LysR family transcriptional regulator [Lysobacter silvisoli]|uniref:LysR family transcriptional regulator n=1 Tax=Lysobacter silvisoli TaxID=2293254 RepID=A0A371JXX2_9GAMM|nr:LysR family transcriptional regulator [Lysobacter silvisoli]RDZ26501.1 LysR family transcriptional regulator [Lysobacter silvisoli]